MLEKITLANCGAGKLDREFAAALETIASDFLQDDKDPKAKRSVEIRLTFEPDEKSERIDLVIQTKVKLPARRGALVLARLNRHAKTWEQFQEVENLDLFEDAAARAEASEENIFPMQREKD